MKVDINEINKLIDKEYKHALQINPEMAFGMKHIKVILNQYDDKLEKESNKQY